MKCAQNSSFGPIWNLVLIEEGAVVIFEINSHEVILTHEGRAEPSFVEYSLLKAL